LAKGVKNPRGTIRIPRLLESGVLGKAALRGHMCELLKLRVVETKNRES